MNLFNLSVTFSLEFRVRFLDEVPDAVARARCSGIYRADSYRRAPTKPGTQSRNCPGPKHAIPRKHWIAQRCARCTVGFLFLYFRPPKMYLHNSPEYTVSDILYYKHNSSTIIRSNKFLCVFFFSKIGEPVKQNLSLFIINKI